jgi:hypothetical protein
MDEAQHGAAPSERVAEAETAVVDAEASTAGAEKLVEKSWRLGRRVIDGYLGVGWPAEGDAEANLAA